jgi:8-amino-7-oxononanoate synthase
MLDFTSALYLGFRHPSRSLRAWPALSAGRPAALAEPPGAAPIARALADLQGCAAATLAASTLHLFWDLFLILAGDGTVAIHVDAAAYPISGWGVERAACHGVPVRRFPHHDPASLRRGAAVCARRGLRPLVVTDGVCPSCGRVAPLDCYLQVARWLGGWVVVDDTQALGVLGAAPGPEAPYGHCGGGSTRWHDIAGPELVVTASLAKGFGVPLAGLSGPADLVGRFEAASQTRTHCSPPSVAALNAAEHALRLNVHRGDELRLGLARLVRHFRHRLAGLGLAVSGGMFPVQTLATTPGLPARALHARLLARGIQSVLYQPHGAHGSRVGFILTARHTDAEVDAVVDALREAVSPPGRKPGGVSCPA